MSSSLFSSLFKGNQDETIRAEEREASSNLNSRNGVPDTQEVAATVSGPRKPFVDQTQHTSGIWEEVKAVANAIRHPQAIDDRDMLLEIGITRLAEAKPGDLLPVPLPQEKIIKLLYNDLTHPPPTRVGNTNAFRTADGSCNNIDMPEMGKAGTSYARSVQQSNPLPQNQLPDPGLLFDTLLRREGFEEHPAGLSSLMFAFATLVIHTVFRTSHKPENVNINETSSYVDLAPLYGNDQERQNLVRKRDGHGLLHPDAFAEERLLLLPPAVCALLVLFNRNHNYIAKKLLEINERGTWVDPATLSPDDPEEKKRLINQEEEIFQIARLINCGWFAAVVFSDYFSCILGLVRKGSSWSLNPFEEIRNEDHSLFERGRGNVCSVEFNCLYRWHATTSAEDEKWVREVLGKLLKRDDPENATVEDFMTAAKNQLRKQPEITQWTFDGLKRQEDRTFRNEDLATIIQNATDHPAGAFRGRGTPGVMRLHEIMGIEQSRKWGVCSLNDFRKYLGLKPYHNFQEWNSNPEIARAAEKLYGSIDNLELYVGLQAEEAKPVRDGAGLCPGYTISRAILSDAIALTRGDRFFTHDFTPYNLTAWGFNDCQRDPHAFGFGSTLGRLFLRTLPDQFSENSVYTFFPLMTPKSMEVYLTQSNTIEQYDLLRPTRQPAFQHIRDYGVVAEILQNPAGWSEPYSARAAKVISGKGFYPVEGAEARHQVINALVGSPEAIDKIGKFFYEATRKLIDAESVTLVGTKAKAVDVVREVFRVVPVQWLAGDVAGLSIKTEDNPSGSYTADELFTILGDIYSFIFLDVEPSKIMTLKQAVEGHIHKLTESIKGSLDSNWAFATWITYYIGKSTNPERDELVKKLRALGYSTDETVNAILALMVVASVELTLALTNIVHLYIDSEGELTQREPTIRALARSTDAKNTEKLNAYIHEALRLEPVFRGVYREASIDQAIAHTSVRANTRVFLDIAEANRNAFPKASSVDISRPKKHPVLHGDGLFRNLGEDLTIKIITQVLRAVYSYDNILRVKGPSGVLQRFIDNTQAQLNYAYLDKSQAISPWPRSLVLKYDA